MSEREIYINNDEIIIEDVTMSFNIIREKFKDLCLLIEPEDKTIKQLIYVEGNPENKVVYTDEETKKLPSDSPDFDNLLANKYVFQFEQTEEIKRQKLNKNYAALSVDFEIIFKASFNQRTKLVSKYCYERGSINKPTVEEYNLFLNSHKKMLLLNSDWTQLNDTQATFSEPEKSAWIDYRSILRQLDKSSDPLKDILIPTQPAS